MGAADSDNGEVFFAFRKFIMARIGQFSPRYLVYEAAFMPGAKQKVTRLNAKVSRRLDGFVAHLEELATEFGLIGLEHPTSEFVKWFTGAGRYESREEKKRATIMGCEARGWKVTSDEADALALLMYAESYLFPRESKGRPLFLRRPEGPLFGAA